VGAAPAHHGAAAVDSGLAAPVALPGTRAGRLAARYLEAFNSGDPAMMRAFTETALAADPDRTTAVRLETYVGLFHQHRRLVVTGIESASEDTLTLRLRSAQGDLSLRVVAEPEPSDRAQSITFRSGGRHP
jgi:hypothetical protein